MLMYSRAELYWSTKIISYNEDEAESRFIG